MPAAIRERMKSEAEAAAAGSGSQAQAFLRQHESQGPARLMAAVLNLLREQPEDHGHEIGWDARFPQDPPFLSVSFGDGSAAHFDFSGIKAAAAE